MCWRFCLFSSTLSCNNINFTDKKKQAGPIGLFFSARKVHIRDKEASSKTACACVCKHHATNSCERAAPAAKACVPMPNLGKQKNAGSPFRKPAFLYILLFQRINH